MKKKKRYDSQSPEECKRRRIERSARKKGATKGKKTTANETSDALNAIRLELEKGDFDLRAFCAKMTPELIVILCEMANSADSRVALPAIRVLMDYAAQASDAPVTGETVRVLKPWPYPDGLGTDVVEMARRYQMMISGEYEMPTEGMRRVQAAAAYREMTGDETPLADFVAKNEAPQTPYVAPERVPLPAPTATPATAPSARDAEPREAVSPNVAVLARNHEGDHRPIVDSKCAFCRQKWVEQQTAAEDERLRVLRPPPVIT